MADTEKKKAPAKPRKSAARKPAEGAEATPAVAAPSNGANAAAKPKKATGNANGAAAEAQPSQHVSHEEIARLAHHFYTQRGHQHGKHEDDWYRAEQELRKRAS